MNIFFQLKNECNRFIGFRTLRNVWKFYCFEVFRIPMKRETRVFEINSPTNKIIISFFTFEFYNCTVQTCKYLDAGLDCGRMPEIKPILVSTACQGTYSSSLDKYLVRFSGTVYLMYPALVKNNEVLMFVHKSHVKGAMPWDFDVFE